MIGRYSTALGIAYQIRDDLEDIEGETDDLSAMRPSLPLALLTERVKADSGDRSLLDKMWRRTATREEQQQLAGLLDEVRRCAALPRHCWKLTKRKRSVRWSRCRMPA